MPVRAISTDAETALVLLIPDTVTCTRALIQLSRARRPDEQMSERTEGRRQVIREPDRIARLLSMLHAEGRLDLERLPGANMLVEVDGPYSLFRFRSPGAGKAPLELEQVTRRSERRVRVDTRLHLNAVHPVHGEIHLDRTVRELSWSGLSFWSDAVHDALWPGLEFDFELTVRGETRVRARGVVRHASDIAGRQVVGLEVLEMDDDSRAQVLDALHPVADKSGANADELWQLYRDSGYFGLSGKTPEDFERYRDEFSAIHALVEQHPQQCAVFSTRTRRGLNASVHQLRMWRRGWLGYQGNRSQSTRGLDDLGHGNLVAAYVRSYEHIAQRGAEWIVTYVQRAGRWARAVNYEVALPWIPQGLASVTPFAAFEVDTRAATQFVSPLQARNATKREQAELSARIQEREAAPYIQATGLAFEDLDGPAIDQWWTFDGLMRRRTVRVALQDGRPVAFAVLDATDPGIHLFQLTNACRIFEVETATPAIITSLLADAGAWFAACGLDRFVYFAAPDVPVPAGEGVLPLGEAWTTVVSGELTPLYVERIMEVATAFHPLLDDHER